MASRFSHKKNRYYISRDDQPTTTNLEHLLHNNATTHTSSVFRIALSCGFLYEFHQPSGDGRTTVVDTYECDSTARVTACFDSSVFADQSTSYYALSRMLSRLNIRQVYHPRIIARLTSLGCEIKDSVSNMGAKEISVSAEIVVVREYARDDGRDLIDRAIRESMVESERRMHGMVPASKSAIFNALKIERICGGDEEDHEHDDNGECRRSKRRRVEHESESCTICMEELPVGSYVSSMPCSHRFHGQCIVKWLQTSHVCPVCRFEIPT